MIRRARVPVAVSVAVVGCGGVGMSVIPADPVEVAAFGAPEGTPNSAD